MKRNDILQITDKINKESKIECTNNELKQYIDYGILTEILDGKYISNTGKHIDVILLKSKEFRFTLNLATIMAYGNKFVEGDNIKRVYCMTKTTYDKYKQNNLIVTIDNKDYFRYFDKELWKILVI